VNPSVSSARPFDNGPFAPSGGTFFYVNQLETTAISNYNALQTSFSVRDRRGFSAQVNYTWSHSIDNASDGQDYVTTSWWLVTLPGLVIATLVVGVNLVGDGLRDRTGGAKPKLLQRFSLRKKEV